MEGHPRCDPRHEPRSACSLRPASCHRRGRLLELDRCQRCAEPGDRPRPRQPGLVQAPRAKPTKSKVANGAPGAFLTGEDGKTLYIFTADTANTSTCADACATNWPPFTVDADETVKAGDGVTGALTTFARADGTMQVAINGMPLYYFAKDAKAGDTNGQGVGGKWFVASPTGAAPVTVPVGAAASTAY